MRLRSRGATHLCATGNRRSLSPRRTTGRPVPPPRDTTLGKGRRAGRARAGLRSQDAILSSTWALNMRLGRFRTVDQGFVDCHRGRAVAPWEGFAPFGFHILAGWKPLIEDAGCPGTAATGDATRSSDVADCFYSGEKASSIGVSRKHRQ